jgi:GNAT superfamily N-acetyltransferase
VDVRLSVRADIDDQALSRLHALAFNMAYRATAWRSQLQQHSLTWITAHDEDNRLVGTVVDPDRRHAGLGTALVQRAATEAAAAGCTWLHVDFEEHLSGFYLDACGFSPTAAGLRRLNDLGH